MKPVARMPLQALAWAGFGLLIAAFSSGPRFAPLAQDQARLTLALAHLTERVEPCRQLSEAERQALPPTRRVSEICERTRRDLAIEVNLDDRTLYRATLPPGGLHRDGRIYRLEQWSIPAGSQRLWLDLAEFAQPGGRESKRQRQQFEFQAEPGASIVLEVEDHTIRLRHAVEAESAEDS